MICLLKSVRLSVWRMKDIHIGGKNLTNLNYASTDKFKFIDTMKYYQSSLGKLSETLTDKEKDNITKLTVQFLINHYFSIVWDQMSLDQKNMVIEIIVSGKGVIPYEKIETIDSLSIKPEDGIFFSKDEFFSTLIGKNVDDFGSVNTRLSFDTELLMPNLTQNDYQKMNIDESFKVFKRDDLKVVYSLKLDEKKFQKNVLLLKLSSSMKTNSMVL